MLTFLRRVPFTFFMMLAITLAGVATGSIVHPMADVLRIRWGIALHDFRDGTWWSLVTDIFFTDRPLMFWGTLAFVPVSIGVYEYRVGTRRTLPFYFLTDSGGSLLTLAVLLVPLHLIGSPLAAQMAYADDVGMSGGGFACVGGWVRRLDDRYRWWIFCVVLLYLLVRVVSLTELYADTLHLITFASGYWIDGALFGGSGGAVPLS